MSWTLKHEIERLEEKLDRALVYEDPATSLTVRKLRKEIAELEAKLKEQP
jgi:phosphate uptake regulator